MKRIGSLLVAIAMIVSLMPVSVLALEGQCSHVHDESCGYAEAAPEIPCDKECTDTDGDGNTDHAADCAYTPATEGTPCTHQHDETCGYMIEPTEPEETEPEEPVQNPITLTIDNENRYEGMKRSYSEGYVPTVENGVALVVLPILCDGTIAGNTLRASVSLGGGSIPFVHKNYEKNIPLEKHRINESTESEVPEEKEAYLISFPLELRWDRIDGSYPVTLTLTGTDTTGNPVNAVFSVYVTITDGRDPNAKETEPKEDPVFPPKILLSSYRCTAENGEIAAGDKVKLLLTLTNTSNEEDVSNMTVKVTSPNEIFRLLTASNTQYIESLGAGKSVEISFEYEIGLAALPGQYDFSVSYDYYYSKALPGQGMGNAKITVGGKLKMSFDAPSIPPEVTVSDTVEGVLQAMNLSRVTAYNVRAVIEADGLRPNGTVFFGNLDGGTAQTENVQITISALSKGDSAYGKTSGIVTYYYEDADGKEYSETRDFTVTIKSPFTAATVEPEDDPQQWWIIMAVIAFVIVAAGASLAVLCIKRKQKR